MEFTHESWAGFKGNVWKKEINVRDFIQNNYTPYEGDDSFLKPSSEKTRKVWNKLTEMFKVEREKGVYDTETKLPQTITTYGPGYIDQKNEVIVGLQTDAPLKRGIFPKGGIRMVENSLEAYGYHLDPMTKNTAKHTMKVFSLHIRKKCWQPVVQQSLLVCRMLTVVAVLSVTIVVLRFTVLPF